MTIEEYVDFCWDQVKFYVEGVQNKEIKVCKWISKAVDRYVADINRSDLEYRVDKVDNVFKFFYFINISKQTQYERFEPLPFQAFIIAALFGPYFKGTNKRKYRYAYLQMSRKNGKSVFATALQLYFLLADGVEDPQSLLLASTREQASICLLYATGIINHSPALAKRLEAQRFKIIFKDRTKSGFSKVLASNANKLDGYSASGAILDEVHSYPDDSLFNVIKSSTLARENPMIFLITTAGFSLTSFCYNFMLYSQNVLNGDIVDDTLFSAIFTLDEGDKIDDVSNWCKANPALGEICQLEDLIAEFNQGRYSITQMNSFITKNLNTFVDAVSSWIPNETLSKAYSDFDITELYGSECYVGMDLSSTRDLSSVVCLIKKEDKYYVVSYFFMANNAEKFLRSGGINLKEWMRDSHIILCDTPTIDYDLIVSKFEEINRNFDVKLVKYDSFNSTGIITQLYKIGLPVESMRQNTLQFNEPLKAIEKLIYDGYLLFNNPVLKWNLNNAVIWSDGNGNIKIMKNKSLDSVDGAVSLGMAMAAYQDVNRGTLLNNDLYN